MASGFVEIANFYHMAVSKVAGPEHADYWWPVVGTAAIFFVVVALGNLAGLHKLKPETMTDEELLPPSKFGFKAFVELCWAVISSTLESIIGKDWHKFVPLLGGTFFFIILMNLLGIVPGFAPPTEQMNMTLGMALVIFVAFNYVGFKYGGIHYVKHLFGPVLFLAPLMFVIELIGLLVRPVSLSLRLFGNIMGDHLVFKVFSTLMRDVAQMPFLPVPAFMLLFGTLVACLQAFIFMTLSTVYYRLSLDSAHHGDH